MSKNKTSSETQQPSKAADSGDADQEQRYAELEEALLLHDLPRIMSGV